MRTLPLRPDELFRLGYYDGPGLICPTRKRQIEALLERPFADAHEWGVFPRRVSPEGKLVIAVFESAVGDFLAINTRRPGQAAAATDEDRETARAWIFEEDVGVPPFTFEVACGVLRRHPDWMRARIVERREMSLRAAVGMG